MGRSCPRTQIYFLTTWPLLPDSVILLSIDISAFSRFVYTKPKLQVVLPYLGKGYLNWVWHSFKCKTPHSWVPGHSPLQLFSQQLLHSFFLFTGGCYQIPWHISITNLAICHSDHRKPRRKEYPLRALFHLHSSLQQQNSLKSLEVWSEWKVFCLNSTPYWGIVSKSQI